jgi:hypothetical protein
MIGSSNFTSAGTGLTRRPNLEANLVYVTGTSGKAYKALDQAFPEWRELDGNLRFQTEGPSSEDEASPQTVLLPMAFGQAVYAKREDIGDRIQLSFVGSPPSAWTLCMDDGSTVFYDEAVWKQQGAAQQVSIPWADTRPPSAFRVRWEGSGGYAWWPVNVENAASLPPPDELRDLPLEVLIDILTSARPLHQAMKAWILRRKDHGGKQDVVELDPHRRVDTSTFLLQRTRRVSWALTALRERLERPVATHTCLEWRLRGPVGVMALVRALLKEAKSEQEKPFLLAELALELSRVRPQKAPACLRPDEVLAEIRRVITELKASVSFECLAPLPDLDTYVHRAFEEALA